MKVPVCSPTSQAIDACNPVAPYEPALEDGVLSNANTAIADTAAAPARTDTGCTAVPGFAEAGWNAAPCTTAPAGLSSEAEGTDVSLDVAVALVPEDVACPAESLPLVEDELAVPLADCAAGELADAQPATGSPAAPDAGASVELAVVVAAVTPAGLTTAVIFCEVGSFTDTTGVPT